MRSVSTLFRSVDRAERFLNQPNWNIGFKYWILDDKEITIDISVLMERYDFVEELQLWNSYFQRYPLSLGQPISEGVDTFFFKMMEVGIFEKSDDPSCLRFTADAQRIYDAS